MTTTTKAGTKVRPTFLRSSTASGRCRHGVRGGQTVLGGVLPPSGGTRGTVVYFGGWGGGDTAGYPSCRSVRREVRKS